MKLLPRYEPYSIRSHCERCGGLEYVARLLVPFHRPLNICRRCRQLVTGVPDTRNMPTSAQGKATIAEPDRIQAPPRIAGLLAAGDVVGGSVS